METKNTIGFIPMELEQKIMIISKRHNIKFKRQTFKHTINQH